MMNIRDSNEGKYAMRLSETLPSFLRESSQSLLMQFSS